MNDRQEAVTPEPKHPHSPTPWWRSGNTMIQSADNTMVARIQVGPLDRRTVFANADLVIRACNAHAALVEALGNTCDALETFAEIAPILRVDAAWEAALTRGRAALAAAKGAKP